MQQLMRRRASFSRCGQYRYALYRTFDSGNDCCVFIGLNPSTGDANEDDPTIRRCMGFTVDWGYQQLIMVNLFAFRTPHPDHLKQARDPEGPRNRQAIRKACASASKIVAAWGNHGRFLEQSTRLSRLWNNYDMHCFGLTKTGQPAHPLYQPRNATLLAYPPLATDARLKRP